LIIRRFFARKGKTNLFSEIREKSMELIKIPHSELSDKGFDYFFAPIIPKIVFENEEEMEDFVNMLMEYHNALAAQFPSDYPRDRGSFH